MLILFCRSTILGTYIGALMPSRRDTSPRTVIVKDEKGDLVAHSHSYYGQVEELFLPDIECTWG
jgi:hypothetical protein